MKKVYVPSSKSITNRALLLAALGDKPVELKNVLDSDDSHYMQTALKTLGVQIDLRGKNTVLVTPPKKWLVDHPQLFIGNAGTATRFLSALSLVVEGTFTLRGVDRMHERPQADLIKVLQSLGVQINALKNKGALPAKFTGPMVPVSKRAEVELSGRVSSQFLSGLMLVAPALKQGLSIKIRDEIPSQPYVKMTLEMLKIWGVKVTVSADFLHFEIEPGFNAPQVYEIPSDMSSASYPLAWSVLRGIPISIENFGTQTLQGDEQFLAVIQKTGAIVTRSGTKLRVKPPTVLKPMGDWNWATMPDVSMTGMVLAPFCPKSSIFTGLESLRVKECDRIVAMAQLQLLGVDFQVDQDTVTIANQPKVASGLINLQSFEDHRMAMCFGILKTALGFGVDPHQKSNLKISHPECVAKTWPDFWLALADWENQLRPVSALILKKVDRYLVVKKPRKENAWQFPQGGVDEGETGRQAAIRELREECGASLNVKIKGERPVGEYRYLFPADFARHDPLLVGAKVEFFVADYISGEVKVDGFEIVEYQWIPKNEFKDYFANEYWQRVQNLGGMIFS